MLAQETAILCVRLPHSISHCDCCMDSDHVRSWPYPISRRARLRDNDLVYSWPCRISRSACWQDNYLVCAQLRMTSMFLFTALLRFAIVFTWSGVGANAENCKYRIVMPCAIGADTADRLNQPLIVTNNGLLLLSSSLSLKSGVRLAPIPVVVFCFPIFFITSFTVSKLHRLHSVMFSENMDF